MLRLAASIAAYVLFFPTTLNIPSLALLLSNSTPKKIQGVESEKQIFLRGPKAFWEEQSWILQKQIFQF